jgi:hypothetical protein
MKSGQKVKLNPNLIEMPAQSSFKIGPGGQRDLISSSSSIGPLKYNIAVMGEKGAGKSTLIQTMSLVSSFSFPLGLSSSHE